MRGLLVSRDIVPVSEFKAHAAQWLETAKAGPVVVTQNGKAAAVLLSPEEYDRLTERDRFIAAVNEGLKAADEGRVTPHEKVAERMRAKMANRRNR